MFPIVLSEKAMARRWWQQPGPILTRYTWSTSCQDSAFEAVLNPLLTSLMDPYTSEMIYRTVNGIFAINYDNIGSRIREIFVRYIATYKILILESMPPAEPLFQILQRAFRGLRALSEAALLWWPWQDYHLYARFMYIVYIDHKSSFKFSILAKQGHDSPLPLFQVKGKFPT